MSAVMWTLGPAHPAYGLPVAAPVVPWLPVGSWSRLHVACLGHGGPELPHVAHGLCRRCYSARLRDLERAEDLEYLS
jgi:hypothetical protein